MINATIRNLRESKGLRQEDLAEAIGVSHQTILKWENGKTEPKASQIKKLADELGVPISQIFSEGIMDVSTETEHKIREIEKLSDEEKKCLNMFIEAMLIRHYSNSIKIQ